MSRLFLDYNAGAPMLPEAKRAAEQALDAYGNPNGLHEESRIAAQIINRARTSVAKLVGAEPSEIFFFPSASLVNYFLLTSFPRVYCPPYEHPSILKSICEPDSQNPALISAMLANNETGEIYNIEHIFAKFPHAKKHSDISQAVGKIPVNLGSAGDPTSQPTNPLANIDFATISSQKIGGGKGAAALFIRGGTPALKATKALKYRLFALGTPNVAAIAAFGAAAEQANQTIQQFQSRVQTLRDELRRRIQAEIPDVVINTPAASLPNTLDVSFLGAEGESIMLMLDHHGIATSTGSACATADGKPSHVLMAMYAHLKGKSSEAWPLGSALPTERRENRRLSLEEIAHGSIRFSFPPDTPQDATDRIMAVLPNIIKKLRSIS
ncbi:MAG: aminotransferase class V-fold PLP-dependent enzyme [Candidatus Nomurabacteria bacterium]|jgi:cysteine desulfurase|nr:aminotransferase class V-fold PLP-dependent enzyme [Candidatus Nomurabacteria bacterium]